MILLFFFHWSIKSFNAIDLQQMSFLAWLCSVSKASLLDGIVWVIGDNITFKLSFILLTFQADLWIPIKSHVKSNYAPC